MGAHAARLPEPLIPLPLCKTPPGWDGDGVACWGTPAGTLSTTPVPLVSFAPVSWDAFRGIDTASKSLLLTSEVSGLF